MTISLEKASDTYVQSLAKGLLVISSFSAVRSKQTLSQVASFTGLTRAGARRILLTLEQLGYVNQEDRYFYLTPKILDLGFSYLSSIPFVDYAQPILEELSTEAGESSSISVLDGSDIIYVVRVPTHQIMSINLSIGSRLPACYTSMGRMLLAHLSEDVLDQVLANSTLKQHTKYTITDPQTLKKIIYKIKQQGWAEIYQELELGLLSIAAPITNRQGKVIAGINISGNTLKYSMSSFREKYLDLLLTKAKQISSHIL